MNDSEKIQFYLYDLGTLLKEKAKEAKQAASHEDAFSRGRLLAFYEVISLMEQQADAFQLDLELLGLEGMDAEQDLL